MFVRIDDNAINLKHIVNIDVCGKYTRFTTVLGNTYTTEVPYNKVIQDLKDHIQVVKLFKNEGKNVHRKVVKKLARKKR